MHARSAWILVMCMACGIAVMPAGAQSVAASDAAAVSASDAASKATANLKSSKPPRARPAGAQPYVYKGTASGDNLWALAGAVVGPAGQAEPIDRNQVMVAIFRANPAAFPEGNMHRIQRGLDLTVPSRADIRREDRAQAAALVAQHRKAYGDRRITPQPLYAVEGAASAVKMAASAAEAASAASAAALAVEGGSSSGSGWWWALGLVGLAGGAAAVLRLLSRRPMLFDPEADDPLSVDAPPIPEDVDAIAEAERDRQRADAAAAALYQEDLSLPEPSRAPAEPPEPAALPAGDPAQADVLRDALADAYGELKKEPPRA